MHLIRHVYRGGGDLRAISSGECTDILFIQADGDRLSRAGARVSRLNPKRNRGHVVRLGAGEGRHVERAPVTVVVVQGSARSSGVTRTRVARQNRLAGGLGNHRGTLRLGLSRESREAGEGEEKSRGEPGRKRDGSIMHGQARGRIIPEQVQSHGLAGTTAIFSGHPT